VSVAPSPGAHLSLQPDNELVTGVSVAVACPRCARPVRAVAHNDPRGWSVRERRLVVECLGRGCGWQGVLVVQLLDAAAHRSRARAS
jgi:hypothetical protein